MNSALGAEVVGAPGSRVGHGLTGGLFAIEQAERVPFQPDFTVGTQLGGMTGVMVFEGVKVDGTALPAADAVKLE
tara:strand:- start:5 stop:229 length:225 start_codon:yes stop_codon:yes gene_type:complete